MTRTTLRILVLMLTSQICWAQQSELPREFRGVWVATVHNIDWPKNKDLSSEEQQQSLIKLLDGYKELNLNAVIFQIRPAADAFYPSEFEPWSKYLTGEQGKAPNPYYDPLKFAIDEVHKRGMEFHAWLNPYRATSNSNSDQTSSNHISKLHPEWILSYGKNTYLDPGIPEVRTYTNQVVKDIVSRYDIDAIHFDDYFYPYKINGKKFPDQDSFKKYGGDFFPDNIDDWRRYNVNTIIKELRTTIKSEKKWVQFGISPFGVWRNASKDPKGSNTKASQTNYDDLYADVYSWLKNGLLDYIVPQSYWHIGFELADYTEVSSWWNKNSFGTNLYIGHSVSRLNTHKAPEWKSKPKTEIEKQLDFNKTLDKVQGSVHFNGTTFSKNPLNIVENLKKTHYKSLIAPPVIYKKDTLRPAEPSITKFTKIDAKSAYISWKSDSDSEENKAIKYLIYQFSNNELVDLNNNKNIIALTGTNEINVNKKQNEMNHIVIVALNRNNRLSSPVILNF